MKNKLIENIFSMVTLRGLEYILAFLLVPYLLRVLGPANFGAIAFMQGIIAYYNIIVDYGFNLTAPREIVLAHDSKWPQIFSAYFWGKFFLWIFTLIVSICLYMILHYIFSINVDVLLFLVVYISVFGNVIFPIWFFQGIQQMRYITILNLIGRLISIGCIFLLVTKANDYLLAAFFQAMVPVVAGISSLFILYRKYPKILLRPSINMIAAVYKNGWKIFISMLAVNLYTSTNVVILGIFTNNTIVGYYSGADKLINCIRRGIDAITTAVYPYITKLLQKDRIKGFSFLKKQLYFYFICGILCGLLIIFGAPRFVPLLLGNQYLETISIFQIMAFIPMVVAISTVFGGETLLPLRKEKDYTLALWIGALFNLILTIPATYCFGAIGTAVVYFLTEILLVVLMGVMLYKNNIMYIQR